MDLKSLNTWQSFIGVLPMSLNRRKNQQKYIMLDGGFYDFCLDINDNQDTLDRYFSDSWSTSTKTFIHVGQENVSLFNWFNKQTETYKIDIVESRFASFVKYINNASFKTPDDMIPFVLNLFRSLRKITQEDVNPSNALALFFKLLISSAEDFNNIDCNLWKIDDVSTPPMFDNYVELINSGVKGVRPNLDLILRHCAGPLFQEAQRTAQFFNANIDLFGNISSDIQLFDNLYTSVHYTPQYLARSIVENVLKRIDLHTKEEITVFDPACGSAAFLIESLNQLKESGYNGHVSVIGWDCSESAIKTAKFLLEYEKRTQWEDKMDYDLRIVQDSLQESWGHHYDIIVMNPPYMSWNLLKTAEQKEALLSALDDVKKERTGKPNQAAGFFYKAIQSLANGGVIGAVLPASLLHSDQYDKLRAISSEMISLECIAHLGNYIFEDALTDVCFIIAQNKQKVETPLTIWCRNEKGVAYDALKGWRKMNEEKSQYIEKNDYSIYHPLEFPILQDTWNVISKREEEYFHKLLVWKTKGRIAPVDSIFIVRQGSITGKRGLFEISAEEYLQLPEKQKKYFRPLAWKENINNGNVSNSAYLWFPYNENGNMLLTEEDAMQVSFVANKLSGYKEELEKRKGIDCWWELTRPRSWQVKKEIRIYSARFGGRSSFGMPQGDRAEEYITEEGNAYTLRNLANELDYYFYLACFCSQTFERTMAIFTKHLQKGYDLAPSQVKPMLIPVLTQDIRKTDAYKKITEFGKMLSSGNDFSINAIDNYLDGTFYPSYEYGC